MIEKIKNNTHIGNYSSRREYIKFKAREFSIQYSKSKHSQQKQYEIQLIQDINRYCDKPLMSDVDKSQLINLQEKLDHLYLKKAQGAYLRSRAKWIEEGEKIH